MPLDFKEVSEIPYHKNLKRNEYGKWVSLLYRFIESKIPYAVVTHDERYNAYELYNRLYMACRQSLPDYAIRVIKRGNNVYLINESKVQK